MPTREAQRRSSIAPCLDRLVVLLEAGIAPAPAWRYLAEAEPATTGQPPSPVSAMAEALARGEPGAPALAAAARDAGGARRSEASTSSWLQVAAAWQIAETSGSPLAPSLRGLTAALRSLDQARRDAAVALSGPTATARVVLALPAVGLVLGGLLGFDSLGVLFGRPVGWCLLAAAAGLVAIGRRWNQALVKRAQPSSAVPGLEIDLLAMALGGGGAWQDARAHVAAAMTEYCAAERDEVPGRDVDELMRLSERAGVPGVHLLRAAADDRRRDAHARAAIAAERLGVALMLPLGLCILPAFVLVGVVPLVISLLSSTGVVG